MRFLVLGGCGFIGSHIVDTLLAAGHEVRIVSRRPEALRAPLPGVDYRLADCRDAKALTSALADRDCVIHAFSATTPGSANRDPQDDVAQNLVSALTLLDLMKQTGVRRLVYLSSGGMVYGSPEIIPTPETHPLRPIGSYGIVKVAVESYIAMYARSSGLLPVILRPSNTYGARQGANGADGAVSALMRSALSGGRFEIWGDGSVVRDYLHVGDLARLCLLAAESDVTGTFNAGSGVGTSLRTIVERVAEVSGQPVDVAYGEARSVDSPVNILDITAATAAFGWSPEVTLTEGLRATWNWHLQHAGAH
jgi:UDP-glucose 4-epimerase